MATDLRTPWQPTPRRRAFAHHPVSVRAARDFVTDTLTDWGVPDRREDIRLCVSELATNALAHGSDRTCGFLVVMSIRGPALRVELYDTGGGAPRLRAFDDSAESGRGLFLVAEYADEWGVNRGGPSKAVWAEFKAVAIRRSEAVSC